MCVVCGVSRCMCGRRNRSLARAVPQRGTGGLRQLAIQSLDGTVAMDIRVDLVDDADSAVVLEMCTRRDRIVNPGRGLLLQSDTGADAGSVGEDTALGAPEMRRSSSICSISDQQLLMNALVAMSTFLMPRAWTDSFENEANQVKQSVFNRLGVVKDVVKVARRVSSIAWKQKKDKQTCLASCDCILYFSIKVRQDRLTSPFLVLILCQRE